MTRGLSRTNEDPDQRGRLVDSEAFAAAIAVCFRNPGAVRDLRDGKREPCIAHLPFQESTVDNDGLRLLQQPLVHGEAVVVGSNFESLHALRIAESLGPAVIFRLL